MGLGTGLLAVTKNMMKMALAKRTCHGFITRTPRGGEGGAQDFNHDRFSITSSRAKEGKNTYKLGNGCRNCQKECILGT